MRWSRKSTTACCCPWRPCSRNSRNSAQFSISLQSGGLVEYHRGNFKGLDRQGLEAAACSCYTVDRKAYADLLG